MKKFLFTLTALLMAGTAFAGRIYIPDTEFTTDQLGTKVFLPVYIELDNEYINGWNVEFTYPENLTVTGGIKKNAAVLTQTAVTDEFGGTENVSFTVNGNSTANTGFCAQQGYYIPEGQTDYVPYGAVKIGPTGTFMLYEIQVEPSTEFTEGYITMRWMYSGGADKRNGQGSISSGDPAVDNGMTTTQVHLTVKQPELQPAPVPTISDDGTKVTAAIEGDTQHTFVLERWNAETQTWEAVSNPCDLPAATYEDQVLKFRAKTIAIEGVDSEDSPYTDEYPVTIPAKDKETVDSPSVQGMSNDDPTLYNIIILGEGDGALNYTVKDAEGNTVTPKDVIVDEETGLVTLVFEKGEEPYTVTVDAYTAEGATCAESDHEVKDITIPALPQVAKPEITWALGDNNTIIVTATCATEGATIVLKDPDGNVVDNPATVTYDPYEGYNGTWTATATKTGMTPSEEGEKTITITAEEKKDVESPSIQGMKHDGSKKLYDIIITPDPATDGQLQYTANPMGTVLGAKAAEPVTIQYERQAEDYDVTVDAKTLEGLTCKESENAHAVITVPKLDQVAKPTVNWSPNNDGTFDIWVTCDTEDATITLTDGENTYTLTPGEHKTISYDIYEGYEGTWTATASATDMLDNTSDPREISIEEQPKVYQTPDPVIGDPVVGDENVTVTVTGEGHLVVKVTTGEGTKTYEGDGTVTVEIPRGEELDMAVIYATATAELPEGYDEVASGEATSDYFDIPALPAKTEEPTIVVTYGTSEWDDEGNLTEDGHFATITIVNNDEGENVVIEYSLDNGQTWIVYDEPVTIKQNGEYTVQARAQAKDKRMSDVAKESFKIDEATALNEIANGKTVAGVRYFNMAGQEMQEANGITIVVTTYTDGTTSAVKVIK